MGAGASSLPRAMVLADLFATSRSREVASVTGFVLALAVGAQVAIPLPGTPVPVTLQTFVVLLGAATLGPSRAVAGVMGYVALGVAGVPWFAVVGGATAGYLVGFLVAAAIVGRAARAGAGRSPVSAALLMVVGNLVIYSLGVGGLVLLAGMAPSMAITAGVAPFLLADALKISLAALLLPASWRAVDRTEL